MLRAEPTSLVEDAIRSALASRDRRKAFASGVRNDLAVRGVRLAASELGRRSDVGVWILTVETHRGFLTIHADVGRSDAFADRTRSCVSAAVLRYLAGQGLLAPGATA